MERSVGATKPHPRRLKTMNGDALQQLKRPLCSELARIVQGTNAATVTALGKQLDLMYKERNINLDKVVRGQDAVYGTMLRVHKDKKRLQRDTYKRTQETMGKAYRDKHTMNRDKAFTYQRTNRPLELPPDQSTGKTPSHVKHNAHSVNKKSGMQDNMTADVSSITHSKPDSRGSMVTTSHSTDASSKESRASDLAPLRLPQKRRSGAFMAPPLTYLLTNEEKRHSTGTLPPIEELSPDPKQGGTFVEKGGDHQAVDNGAQSPCSERRASSSCSNVDRTRFPDLNTQARDGLQSPDSHSKNVDYLKLTRMREKQREQEMKEMLDNEEFTLYLRDKQGRIIASETPFRRKEFVIPSHKEKHNQQKMLSASLDERMDQRNRQEVFFGRLAKEEDELRARREQKRVVTTQPEQPVPETDGPVPVTLSQMVAVFARRERYLPEGMDPRSFEALRHCGYIRPYSPLSEDQRRQSERNKVSSWEQAG